MAASLKQYRLPLTYLAIVMVSLLLALIWWLRSGLFQEPLTTLLTAARLEIQQIDILPVGRDHNEWIFGTRVASAESPLTQRLTASGWRYVDQMGAGWFYEKQGERVVVICRLYSPRYQICRSAVPLE